MTIQELRNCGYKVKVLHNRLYHGQHIWQVRSSDLQHNAPIDPDPKGGSTMVIIDAPTGEHFEGVAVCSKQDNYDKKMGVRIALGRCGFCHKV